MSLKLASDKKSLSCPDKKKKLSSIVNVVRALIASKKPPYKLRDILKEYPQVEGSPLPYLALGYDSAEDLLKDSNEFVISHIDNEVCLALRNGGKCQHISDLVVNQKVSKSKRLVAAATTETHRKPRESAKNWNKSTYSSNLFGRFTTPQNKLFLAHKKNREGDRNNNNWRSGNKLHPLTTSNLSGQFKSSTKPTTNKKVNKDDKNANFSKRLESDRMEDMFRNPKYPLQKNKVVDKSQLPDLRETLCARQQVDKAYPRAILGQQKQVNGNKKGLNIVVTQSPTNSERQQKNNIQAQLEMQKIKNFREVFRFESGNEQSPIKSESNSQELKKSQHKQNQNIKQAPQYYQENGPRNYSSVQNRLKINSQKNNVQKINGMMTNQEKSNITTHSFSTPEKVDLSIGAMRRAAVEVLNEQNPLESLYEYCALCNFESPQFSVSKAKFEKNYQCRVQINDSIYFTYPDDYASEVLSKIGCALKAIEQIKAAEYRRPMRPCTITDYEFIERLHADLSLHPHGMFSNKISEFYENKYKETTPEHWWSLVTVNVNKFLIEKIQSETVIVFAKDDTNKDEVVSQQMEGITLPWGKKHWELFVTYVVSPIEVWCRLFGDNYDKCFIKLNADIKAYMKIHKQTSKNVMPNHIYLAGDLNDEWHRVRVMDINKTAESATVFYIDYGDTDSLPLQLLYDCEQKFLHLPAQAVPFTLFGLEDLYGNPFVLEPLQKHMPFNKAVVGEVITNEESFNSDTSAGGKIQVAIFDTSTNNDINLNELIMNELCRNSPLPTLKMDAVTNVIISHVSIDGAIHFRKKGPESDYVEKLIYQLVESKVMTDESAKAEIDDIKSGKLILLCDKSDNDINWYRGKVADVNDINLRDFNVNTVPKNNEEFDMVYVDHGFIKRTHVSNMYPLDTLSFALYKFPQQRLKARLRKIPDINKEVVGLIRSLMPHFCEAMFKMAGNDGDMPLVKAYRRIPPNPYLVPLNNIIRNEYEMGKFIVSEFKDTSLTQDGINSKDSSPTIQNCTDMKYGLNIIPVPTSPKKASNDLPFLKEYTNFPKLGEYLNVMPFICGSPSSFMVQPYDERKDLKKMMTALHEYCENNDDFIPFNDVKVGQAYAAKNNEGVYCRVIVKHIISSDIIHIIFCDFGDSITVNNENLKFLPAKFRELPKMALHARVWNVEPKDGEYTFDECVFFRKLAVGRKFASVVKNIVYDPNGVAAPILHLDLIDTSAQDVDVLMRDHLFLHCNVVRGNAE